MSKDAERLMRHLYDNTWSSESYLNECGYAEAVAELLAAGLVERSYLDNAPVILCIPVDIQE